MKELSYYQKNKERLQARGRELKRNKAAGIKPEMKDGMYVHHCFVCGSEVLSACYKNFKHRCEACKVQQHKDWHIKNWVNSEHLAKVRKYREDNKQAILDRAAAKRRRLGKALRVREGETSTQFFCRKCGKLTDREELRGKTWLLCNSCKRKDRREAYHKNPHRYKRVNHRSSMNKDIVNQRNRELTEALTDSVISYDLHREGVAYIEMTPELIILRRQLRLARRLIRTFKGGKRKWTK